VIPGYPPHGAKRAKLRNILRRIDRFAPFHPTKKRKPKSSSPTHHVPGSSFHLKISAGLLTPVNQRHLTSTTDQCSS